MPLERILHIGAHRTGTTSLQSFLSSNRDRLQDGGVQVLYPPTTRSATSPALDDTKHVVISEENLLGTMESNIWQQTLYPNIADHLSKHASFTKSATMVLLSVRNLAAWWRSAILFCAQRDLPLPTPEMLEAISVSDRSWYNVVQDVQNLYPKARLIVREFAWKTNNPKQFLRQATGLDVWQSCKTDRHRHNAAPDSGRLSKRFIQRNDLDSLTRLEEDPALQLFSDAQLDQLHDRYEADLSQLQSNSDIAFLFNRKAYEEEQATEFLRKQRPVKPATHGEPSICILNIGRAGAEELRIALGSKNLAAPTVHFCGHNETLLTTIDNYGDNRRLGIVFRHPEQRFIASFYGRLRQGRPQYDAPWSVGEAIAFQYFQTPNELAEALTGDDERLLSAARFAFEHIFHLKLDYRHYLSSPAGLLREAEADRVTFCFNATTLVERIPLVAESLGMRADILRKIEPIEVREKLSPKAKAALKNYWSEEYELYETLQAVEASLQ